MTGSFQTMRDPRAVGIARTSSTCSASASRAVAVASGARHRLPWWHGPRPRARDASARAMTRPRVRQSTALLTDRYELTMLGAALRDGTAARRCVFEVFARRLPDGRRYGVVAGTGRLLDAIERLPLRRRRARALLREPGVVDEPTARLAGRLPVHRRRRRLPRGRAVLPRLAGADRDRHLRRGGGAGDAGAVGAQPRLRDRLGRGPDGHRGRAAGRSSRWARGAPTRRRRWPRPGPPTWPASPPPPTWRPAGGTGCPTAGTAAHAFTLLHDDEAAAFAAQVDALGHRHHAAGRHLRHRPRASGPRSRWPARTLGAIRIDSGDLAVLARQARELLDSLGATGTRIVVSGDLDEYAIAGAGRRAGRRVRGGHRAWSPAPARRPPGMVYKLVEVDGRPVAKRSEHKATQRRPEDRGAPAPSRPGPRPRRCWSPGAGPSSARTTGCCSVPLMRGGSGWRATRPTWARRRARLRRRACAPYRGRG